MKIEIVTEGVVTVELEIKMRVKVSKFLKPSKRPISADICSAHTHTARRTLLS